MIKKLAELWMIFIFVVSAFFAVLFWFYVIALLIAIMITEGNFGNRLLYLGMLLFMITVTAREIDEIF